MATAPERFDPKKPMGWVVENTSVITRKGKNGREHISYWYGPDHGFGTTFGPLDYSAAVWPTKKEATEALRRAYGGTRNSRVIRTGQAIVAN